jgi:transglutaminase-like putative cysteine protease
MIRGLRVRNDRLRVQVGCQFDFTAECQVPMLMLVRPRTDGQHVVLHESRTLVPALPLREYRDHFGNECWRFEMPGGALSVRYDALVEVSAEPDPVPRDLPLLAVQDLPEESLLYTLPSRYIQSDLLVDAAWDLFGWTPPTGQRVLEICDWVHRNISYQGGSSDLTVTAFDTFNRRYGVCRDIALLTVAFCRAMNVPARYAFGYLPDIGVIPPDSPMDFHAWFNAYIDGRWYTFDARHNVPRIGRIEIGHGPDPVDVAMSTSFGSTQLTGFEVWSEEVADEPCTPLTVLQSTAQSLAS